MKCLLADTLYEMICCDYLVYC